MISNYELAREVLAGKWGNGSDRRTALENAGYNYDAVQSIVNSLVHDRSAASIPVVELAQKRPLEIDYDPERYDGIIVNVIIGGNP